MTFDLNKKKEADKMVDIKENAANLLAESLACIILTNTSKLEKMNSLSRDKI